MLVQIDAETSGCKKGDNNGGLVPDSLYDFVFACKNPTLLGNDINSKNGVECFWRRS